MPDILPIDRTTRLHLQTLVAHGDLVRRRYPAVGGRNVYQLSTRGSQLASSLCTVPSLRPIGISHQDHELLITEWAVSLLEATRARADVELPWQARWDLAQQSTFQLVVPDYAFLLRTQLGTVAGLVEISAGEDSATRLGEKLNKYAVWADSAEACHFLVELYRRHGASNPRSHFRLLFVLQNRQSGHDQTRLRQLLAHVLTLSTAMRSRVWAATLSDLQNAGSIDSPVWVRGSDLEGERAAYLAAAIRERPSRLAAVLTKIPRHYLFPRG